MGILEKIGLKKKTVDPAMGADGEAKQAEKKPEIRPTQASSTRPGKKGEAHPRGRIATGQAYRILLRPVLSEKGTHLASLGRYVFAVHPKANKSEIGKSVEQLYDVHVESVKILKVPGKTRRYGRSVGKTAAWKKAIVVLSAGEKIPGIIEAVG